MINEVRTTRIAYNLRKKLILYHISHRLIDKIIDENYMRFKQIVGQSAEKWLLLKAYTSNWIH